MMCTILQFRSATDVPPAQICHRRWLLLWLGLAIVNLAAAIALATEPDRARDLHTVRRWTHQWMFEARDLYSSPTDAGADYPPHAIVALSPLSLVPQSAAVPSWAAMNILFAFLAPVLAARFIRPRARAPDILCLVLLFLCWSGTRSLLQFSLVTLVFGLAALVLADRRPAWSGVCLGLALMKPQIGVPFLLWVVFARRWKVAGAAALLIASGTLVWCARAGANPVRTTVKYVEILRHYYAGDASLSGVSRLRPLVAEWLPGPGADIATAALSIAFLVAICLEGFRHGKRRIAAFYPAPALTAIWSLLTFYHLTYGFVLLLPAAAVVLLAEHPSSAARLRNAVLWIMQIWLVVDVPGFWRRFVLNDPEAIASAPVFHYYRVSLAILAVALWILHRQSLRSEARSV